MYYFNFVGEMVMMLSINCIIRQDVLCVRVGGELDHHTAVNLKDQITEEITKSNIRNLIINLEELHFMDSSGIGVLLGRYNQIKDQGGRMVLCCALPAIVKLLEMSGIFKIMTLEVSEQDAFRSLEVSQ